MRRLIHRTDPHAKFRRQQIRRHNMDMAPPMFRNHAQIDSLRVGTYFTESSLTKDPVMKTPVETDVIICPSIWRQRA